MKRQFRIPPGFSQEKRDFIIKNYRLKGRSNCRRLFNQQFHTTYSDVWIEKLAKLLNANGADVHPEYYSTAELSDLLEVHQDTIARWIRKGQIKGVKFAGQGWMVRREIADPLIQAHIDKKRPWDGVHVKEAGERLGYECNTSNPVASAAAKGHIESYREDGRVYVRLEDVLEAERYMARTGYVRVPWSKPNIWRNAK